MLIDSYSWIEFFHGTEKGEKVKEIIEEKECSTSIVSVSEITEWCLKNSIEPDSFMSIIKEYSNIMNLNDEIVIFAGKINFENKKKIPNWGMIDLKVLTGDKHFSGLKNAEML